MLRSSSELVELAKLTYQKRQQLPRRAFVFPATRSYPIDTAGRARNALSRVARFGSPHQRAMVCRAVHARWPMIHATSCMIHHGNCIGCGATPKHGHGMHPCCGSFTCHEGIFAAHVAMGEVGASNYIDTTRSDITNPELLWKAHKGSMGAARDITEPQRIVDGVNLSVGNLGGGVSGFAMGRRRTRKDITELSMGG